MKILHIVLGCMLHPYQMLDIMLAGTVKFVICPDSLNIYSCMCIIVLEKLPQFLDYNEQLKLLLRYQTLPKEEVVLLTLHLYP